MPGEFTGKEYDRLYGEDYFQGETSGYPKSGYQILKDSWEPWLDFICHIKPPPATIFDLGSAFGYFGLGARKRGYTPFGVEISTYALDRLLEAQQISIRSDIQTLPLLNDSADIVTIFDVLEHLNNPLQCLQEAKRVLKHEGLLILTTPDPLFFDRTEPTHFFERPPSFWIKALEDLRMECRFRFSVQPYNFQLVAAHRSSQLLSNLSIFNHDYFTKEEDFVRVSGDQRVTAVPRFGWGALENSRRKLTETSAAVYVHNSSSSPFCCRINARIENSQGFSSLRIRFNGYVLSEIQLNSETQDHQIEVDEVFLPAGGNHLFFDLLPGGPDVHISGISFSVTPVASVQLTETLPFDLFQRYELARAIGEILDPESILDVGGHLGDQHGHLATSANFFPSINSKMIVTTDLRQCDLPNHTPVDASSQPFEDGAFDMVISFDVLEHLPRQDRPGFLEELDRLSAKWIVLGAPFFSADVDKLEDHLSSSLNLSFLDEHRKFGLPETALVTEFFEAQRGYSVRALPNGYLWRWGEMQLLTQLFFSIRDHQTIQNFNRVYNRCFFASDNRNPCYRTVFVISKSHLTPAQDAALQGLCQSQGEHRSREDMVQSKSFPAIFERSRHILDDRDRALSDTQYLTNCRQELIDILQKENENLKQELTETPLVKLAWRRWKQRK